MLTLCLTSAAALMSARQPTTAIPGILVTRQLMEARSLRVGDVVRLSRESSGASARAFRIDGVYEPTPDPLRFAQPKFEVRMHLPDLSSLVADPSDPGSLETVTAINVALTQPADAAAVRSRACRTAARRRRPANIGARRSHQHLRRPRALPSGHCDCHRRRERGVPARPDGDARRGAAGHRWHPAADRLHATADPASGVRRGSGHRGRGALLRACSSRLHPRGSSTGSSSGATTQRWSSCGSRRAWRCSRWPWRFHWAYWPASSRRGRSCGSSC